MVGTNAILQGVDGSGIDGLVLDLYITEVSNSDEKTVCMKKRACTYVSVIGHVENDEELASGAAHCRWNSSMSNLTRSKRKKAHVTYSE